MRQSHHSHGSRNFWRREESEFPCRKSCELTRISCEHPPQKIETNSIQWQLALATHFSVIFFSFDNFISPSRHDKGRERKEVNGLNKFPFGSIECNLLSNVDRTKCVDGDNMYTKSINARRSISVDRHLYKQCKARACVHVCRDRKEKNSFVVEIYLLFFVVVYFLSVPLLAQR